MDSADNVRAAVESIAQLIPSPALRAAWLNYAAAQAERDAQMEVRLSNLQRNQTSLRGELDGVIANAIRRELEGTELRVIGFGALVDAIGALSARMDVLEAQGQAIIARLPPRPIPEEEATA